MATSCDDSLSSTFEGVVMSGKGEELDFIDRLAKSVRAHACSRGSL